MRENFVVFEGELKILILRVEKLHKSTQRRIDQNPC